MKKKLLKVFILIIFLLGGIFATYKHIQKEYGWLSLNLSAPTNLIDQVFDPETGNYFLRGSFLANYRNLGTIKLPINTNPLRLNEVSDVVFRVKKIGDKEWFYEGRHVSNKFPPVGYYPFGFPLIVDSMNNKYLFEVEILADIEHYSLELDSSKYSNFITKYQFTWDEVKHDKKWFFEQKINSLVGNSDFVVQIILYFVPFLFSLFLFVSGSFYFLLYFVVVVMIWFDIYFGKNNNFLLYLYTAIFWAITVWRYRFERSVTASFALITVALIPLYLTDNNLKLAEKSAIWTYLILVGIFIHFFVEQIYLRRFKQISFLMIVLDIYLRIKSVVKFGYVFVKDIKFRKSILSLNIFIKLLWLIFRYVIIYGGLLWLAWRAIIQPVGYLNFYQDFLPSDQMKIFFTETGFYLIGFYVVVCICLMFYWFKCKCSNRLLGVIVALIFTLWGAKMIFGKTTTALRDNVHIWSISPKTVTLWDEVTIVGRNFKEMPFTSSVTIAGVKHRILKWSDREIVIQAEPGKTRSGDVVVTNMNGQKSNPVKIEVYDFFTKKIVK